LSETKKDSRQMILDAALSLFSQKGFSGTTTKEIAKEAGFAEGTVFRYFPTKKDILIALAEPHAVAGLKRVMNSLPNQDEESNLRAILENRLVTIAQNKDLLKVIFTEAQYHEDFRKEVFDNIGTHVLGTVAGYMEKRMETGIFRSIDPIVATRILVGMMLSLLVTENFLPMKDFDQEKRQGYLDEIVHIFLYGLTKR